MKTIAHDYMERMGIKDTLFVIVRHNDHDHPHCHIVYSRVDNNGRTISDHNDRFRSQKACEDITRQYGLRWGESRKKVNRERLRPHDAAKYHISDILEVVVPQCRNWEQLERTLKANGISVEFKCNPNTGERQGVSFGYDDGKENHVFPVLKSARNTVSPICPGLSTIIKRHTRNEPAQSRFRPHGRIRHHRKNRHRCLKRESAWRSVR